MHNLERKVSSTHRCETLPKKHSTKFCAALISIIGPTIHTNWTCVKFQGHEGPAAFPFSAASSNQSKLDQIISHWLSPRSIKNTCFALLQRGLVNGSPLQLFIIHLVKEYSLMACHWKQFPLRATAPFTVDVLMSGPGTVFLRLLWLHS